MTVVALALFYLILSLFGPSLIGDVPGEQISPHPRLHIPGCQAMDLGAGQPGEVLTGTIPLHNLGAEPLTFRARWSCGGCTVLEPREGTIESCGQTELRVGIRLSEKGRDVTAMIQIESNDPDHPEVSYLVHAHCPAIVDVRPARVDFGAVTAGAGARREVRVKLQTVEREALTVAAVGPYLTAELGAADQRGEVPLHVRLLPTAPRGYFQSRIQIATRDGADEVIVPVSADVRGALLAAPNSLLITEDAEESGREYRVLIWRSDGEALGRMIRAESPDWLEVVDGSDGPAERRIIRVRVLGLSGRVREDSAAIRMFFPGLAEPAIIQVWGLAGLTSSGHDIQE